MFKSNLQKWCQKRSKKQCPKVTLKITSQIDVQKWHPKVTSKMLYERYVQKLCPKGTSKRYVQKWCTKVISKIDIKKGYQKVFFDTIWKKIFLHSDEGWNLSLRAWWPWICTSEVHLHSSGWASFWARERGGFVDTSRNIRAPPRSTW